LFPLQEENGVDMNHTEITQAGREAWLGQSHGYRIAGDWACLNAELALSESSEALAQQWALQLWACDQPYQGGALQGTKIAEATLDVQTSQPQHLYAETFARLPTGDREYAMVLVLASRSDGAEQVHDFANYPALEHFHVPALRGEVSHRLDAEQLTLRAERIENPRSEENLSGTLALELWTLDAPYQGEQFTGNALGGVELGRLAGQAAWQDVELRVSARELAGRSHLTVMLREWTASGYVTRDYRDLALTLPLPAAEPVLEPVKVVEAAPVSVTQPGLVSVQHATLDALAAVPGLSRKLAQEIIKARPFSSLDQLVRVRGIGEKTLRKLRAVLTL
jgi:hypothetical protein